jgi:hypothetical protein
MRDYNMGDILRFARILGSNRSPSRWKIVRGHSS